ncbi:hypothetical protein L208DRAFT_1459428 [Tricholoma matsutake]|nr:hypothetical protein L208DRAFT_1459428 [Tricholoma matsutake 945]
MSTLSCSPPSKRLKLESSSPRTVNRTLETRQNRSYNQEGTTGDSTENEHQCSICLQAILDRTVIPTCSHEFCFECLLVWSEQSRRCPLCSQAIGQYVIHTIRSRYDFRKHYLAPLSPEPQVRQAQEERTRQRRAARARARDLRMKDEREESDKLERSIAKRRWVYQHNLYAKHVASNSYTKYRPYPTPAQFSASTELVSRTTIFLRRELRVWDDLDVEFLTSFIISLMKSIDIRSESAVKLLAEFLDMDAPYVEGGRHLNAEHFAHEVYSYVRSPFRDLFVMTRLRDRVFLNHGQIGGGSRLAHAHVPAPDLVMLDRPLHAVGVGGEVTRCHGHHRAEPILERAPKREHFMFREYPNMRGFAAENGVPIAITMACRVMPYEMRTWVMQAHKVTFRDEIRSESRAQVMPPPWLLLAQIIVLPMGWTIINLTAHLQKAIRAQSARSLCPRWGSRDKIKGNERELYSRTGVPSHGERSGYIQAPETTDAEDSKSTIQPTTSDLDLAKPRAADRNRLPRNRNLVESVQAHLTLRPPARSSWVQPGNTTSMLPDSRSISLRTRLSDTYIDAFPSSTLMERSNDECSTSMKDTIVPKGMSAPEIMARTRARHARNSITSPSMTVQSCGTDSSAVLPNGSEGALQPLRVREEKEIDTHRTRPVSAIDVSPEEDCAQGAMVQAAKSQAQISQASEYANKARQETLTSGPSSALLPIHESHCHVPPSIPISGISVNDTIKDISHQPFKSSLGARSRLLAKLEEEKKRAHGAESTAAVEDPDSFPIFDRTFPEPANRLSVKQGPSTDPNIVDTQFIEAKLRTRAQLQVRLAAERKGSRD